eukprot:TRINITY_DN1489_c3_g1_i2.p1 TRINITY_DN1489_c3_g1~~TRINITY_DN1489_c3_g1_i2.p1  ORF type:complete len:267 (-),score=36.54 TRINITY_DN1489_c3_g1_i2:158-958(-)
MIMTTPESTAFQHTHEMMSLLAVAWEYLEADPEIKVITDGTHMMVWEHIGFKDRVIASTNGLSVGELHIPCAGPDHPWKWQKVQQILRIPVNTPLRERRYIVYFTRNNMSGRRHLYNQEELLGMMREWIAEWNQANAPDGVVLELDVFDRLTAPSYGPKESIERITKRARALIGPHGGSLYDGLYACPGTLSIELHPYLPRRAVQPGWDEPLVPIWSGFNTNIFYDIHMSVGLRYYHLPCLTDSDGGRHMTVDVANVRKIFDKELK